MAPRATTHFDDPRPAYQPRPSPVISTYLQECPSKFKDKDQREERSILGAAWPASNMKKTSTRPTKGRRIRTVTDDRRRQNRECQRRYRERKKATQNIDLGSCAEDASLLSLSDELGGALDFLDQTTISDAGSIFDVSLDCLDTSAALDPSFATAQVPPSGSDRQSLAPQRSSKSLQAGTSNLLTLPSPYQNYLHIQKLNFYAARIQNALHLGIPLRLAEKGEWSISPWYYHARFADMLPSSSSGHPTCSDSTYIPGTVIAPRTDRFIQPIPRKPCFQLAEAVAPDLAPTALQRSHPHDMYLDSIPFPVFRDRVITLLAMDPPSFDEEELRRDIEAEGLLVWGVAQGTRDRTSSLVRDRRNWECAKWFRNKWKLLINGSGLEEQSRWWRSMRGEEDSDDDF